MNTDRYFCTSSNESGSNNKLIFYKVKKIRNVFTDKSHEDLSKTHTLINEDFVTMHGSGKFEKQFVNSNNNIKTEHKDQVKSLFEKNIEVTEFNNYLISSISIDKYNVKLKVLLSSKGSQYILSGDIFFNNRKFHNIIMKLKDKNISTRGVGIKNLFTEEECKYMYNFFEYYYKYFDITKTNKEYTDIVSKHGIIKGKEYLCEYINKEFEAYYTASHDFDITQDIKGVFKNFPLIIYNSNPRRQNTYSNFYKNINVIFYNIYVSTTHNFTETGKYDNINFIDNLYHNYFNTLSIYYHTNVRHIYGDSISFHNILINNVNNIKFNFINENILDKNHNGSIQIKTENEFVYLDKISSYSRTSQEEILINIRKFSFYLDTGIYNSIIDNKNSISHLWITRFLNNKYNFYKLTGSKYNEPHIKFNEKPLELVKNSTIMGMFNTQPNNKNVSINKIDKYFKITDISKIIENMLLKPFDYQLENCKWMRNIENKINGNQFDISYLFNPEFKFINNTSQTDIAFKYEDYDKSKYSSNRVTLIKDLQTILQKSRRSYKINGGILSDDVGLGKTLSCMTHILTSLPIDVDKGFKEKMPYQGNNLIIVPNRLVAQWYTEIKSYVKSAFFKKLNVMKIVSITDIKKKLYGINIDKHSIYIISNNLINNMNYIKYITDDIYDITEYHKFVKALSSACRKPYHDLIKSTHKKYKDFKDLGNQDLLNELEIYKLDDKKKFNIFTIKWNRIILDEAHEVLNTHIKLDNQSTCVDKCKRDLFKHNNNHLIKSGEIVCQLSKNDRVKFSLLCKLRSNFKWCLTATPFKSQIINLYSYINFLNVDLNDDINDKPDVFHTLSSLDKLKYILNYTDNQISNGYGTISSKSPFDNTLFGMKDEDLKVFFTNYIRLNKKQDIKGVVDIPIFTEEITFLNQNSVERNIYVDALRSNNHKRLFQLCTHLLVSDGIINSKDFGDKILNLEEIQELMVKKYKKDIAVCQKKLVDYAEKNKSLENLLGYYKKIESNIKEVYNFNDSSDGEFHIEQHMKEQIKAFLSINSYSGRYYTGRYQKIEMLVNIDSIVSHKDNIIRYADNIIDLNKDINEIMEFPLEFNKFKYKVYTIYKLYKNDIISQIGKLDTNKENIDKENREIARLYKQIKLFENNTFITESVQDPCSICFSDFEGDIAITSCRHIMCGDCIKLLFSNHSSANCPFCRTSIRKKDVNFTHYDKIKGTQCSPVPDEQEKQDETKSSQKEENIKKYGTKLAHMLEYLGEIFKGDNNRVIIFSQYDNMLKLIGKVLDDFKIKNLFIKGNITSVSKKIDKFKTDPSYRVIMLSSERCSSGSNLTEASHIILADVINGDAVATKDMESQAIGRAVRIGQKKPVVVKRFIMSNTIEEEYYTKNKYDMMDLQL